MPAEHRIHQSLLAPPFFLGVTFEVLVGELVFLLGLFVGFGASKVVLIYGALTLLVVHPLIARFLARDPLALRLLVESMHYRRFYPAHGTLVPTAVAKPRGCLPKV